MKKILFAFVVLTIANSISIQAQVTTHAAQYNAGFFMEHVDRMGSNNLDYIEDEYNGTPYNNPIFLLGKIYENNKVIATNYALRYNAMADEIEVKETLYKEDSEIKVLAKSPDLYVKIMNEMFVFVDNSEANDPAGYFLVLHVGNSYNLYKKMIKKYYPAKKAQTSFEKDILASFVDKPVYYLVSQDGVFKEFTSSKSKKLKVFGDKQSEIKNYIKKAKLDINDENDLLKIVKYYDSVVLSLN